MRVIRRWIYRLGFSPKPGSIFYSPSIAMTKATNIPWKDIEF